MFPAKYLIVNADDFNLTRGTDRAILECHDRGIVSSTTVLVTLPFSAQTAQQLKSRPFLGKGIHLSLTLGTAVNSKTSFRLTRDLLKKIQKIPAEEARGEYEAQILKFRKILGELPSHMDTHHHIQTSPNIVTAVKRLSVKYRIPFRGCTHHLFEDLDPSNHWTREKFTRVIKKLPAGISEIMVHPGYADRDLRAISSFQNGREVERKILSDATLRSLLDQLNIKLISFRDLAYFSSLYEKTSHSRH